MVQYNIYPTLLDKFESYINSSRIYQQYWGFADEPSISEEEFEQQQFQSLINGINRVPFESEAADKGTAFNEVIDCIIQNRTSEKMEIKSFRESGVIAVNYKQHVFNFPFNLTVEIAKSLSGAVCSKYTEGILDTRYGKVKLYGIIDQLMPFTIIDLKTTSKYNSFKYRDNSQHRVYPFCLNQEGIHINEFEYIVTDFKSIWSEYYTFNEIEQQNLLNHVERFIEFLEAHRHLITDTRIFAVNQIEVIS